MSSTDAGRSISFAPPELKRFLRRRAVETGGLLIAALSLAALLAIASHDAADPSWNRATDGAVANWLGAPGAIFADLMLQAAGPVTLLLFVVPFCLGIRVAAHRPAARPRRRAVFALAGTGVAAFGLGAASDMAGFGATQFGGVLGSAGSLMAGLAPEGIAWIAPVAGALLVLSGLIMLAWASAVPPGWMALPVTVFFRRPSAEDDDDDAAETDGTAKAEPRSKPQKPKQTRAEKRVKAKAAKPKPGVRAEKERQPELALQPDAEKEEPQLPPLSLLYEPTADDYPERASAEALEQNARMLESVLDDFGVKGEITDVRPGPVVTLYELKPAPGTKSSRVIGLADDIARSMSAISARVAVVPGRDALGIELPNNTREIVFLREMLASAEFESHKGTLTLALGKDIGGDPVFADLAKMPHLLIAGTTGSGKSVGINTMILSLLYRLTPDQCRMIMIDPKMLELSVYEGIPHLLTPVVTDPKKAVVALKWAVKEMEARYRKMSDLNVRNIAAFNQRVAEAAKNGEELSKRVQTGFDPETDEATFEDVPLDTSPMPQIVIIVDEMADLMLVAGKEIEGAIQRLAQMARAAGIHLIMATQRPSVDVITGTIKANFPTRISFSVTSKIDSRTILGEQGAEQLLGQGDMLFMPNGSRVGRVHGPFVSDGDVEKITKWIAKTGKPEYLDDITREPEGEGDGGFGMEGGGNSSDDPMFDQAVEVVARSGKASTSFVQRQLKIGYNRAARIIEQMEEEGMVSAADHVGKREVLLRNPDED
ncbi:MAG: DNA translocase FtsK 4TM domain-containing protein [Minwuia sp.]|uniref:FtsK/SpoIIIE family DNA translocase n=1 Tax=Minwuia sp. TaxID=2493630 RepID=UPI003A8BEBE0